MDYIYDYLYCSLAFLSVIGVRFFSQRQFPSIRNRIFGIIIIVAFADLLLDIFSSVVIENVFSVLPWLTYLVCYCFYTLQCLLPLLLLLYIFSVANLQNWLCWPKLLIVVLPTALTLGLLYSNFFTYRVFYVDPVAGYVHAPLFIILYTNIFLSVSLSFFITLRCRKAIVPIEFRTVLAFLAIVTVMVIVQYLMPRYLVSSPSIALALTLMYIVMQKPEDMIDAVSGAFNSTALMLFAKTGNNKRKPFSIIIVELLYMRRINRIFGMDFGSRTLEAAASKMMEIAHGGWVFRTMGNIFVLANYDREKSLLAYEAICSSFDGEFSVDGVSLQLTATVLGLPDIGSMNITEEMGECLDSALSTTERGEHRVIPAELLLRDRRKSAIEDALIPAIAEGGIRAVLQPIYSLKQKRFVTAEALARFHHATLGEVSLAEFIPIAEKNGQILKIDNQIIHQVCRYLKDSDTELTAIEINLSPVEFVSEQLCSRIIEIVEGYGVDPSRIWFEITESNTNIDPKILGGYMQRLRAEGFRFALDDYGTGFSNISRIMNLPFSLVKLDRSMLLAGLADKRNELVMRSTIQMLQALELETLVEGVETEAQAEVVASLGVDYVQGFYYARPMPMDKVSEYIRKHRVDGEKIEEK